MYLSSVDVVAHVRLLSESLNELSTAISHSFSNAAYQSFPAPIKANVKPAFKSPWTAEHEGVRDFLSILT